MDKTIELSQDMFLIIEVVTNIIQEVVKGMEDRIIIIMEGETFEIKITIEIGVGHTKDRIEIGGMLEVLVTLDHGQVQE